jgi:hypothetical protein
MRRAVGGIILGILGRIRSRGKRRDWGDSNLLFAISLQNILAPREPESQGHNNPRCQQHELEFSEIFAFSILSTANMSLKAVYERFLGGPTLESLTPDVSLHYITTTTTISRSEQVIDHLARQDKVVKKKSEKILSAVEGASSLCLDVEITLEFVSGGGAYLLAVDDNFLTDHTVTFPMASTSSAFRDS